MARGQTEANWIPPGPTHSFAVDQVPLRLPLPRCFASNSGGEVFKFRLWCFHRTIWNMDLRLLDFELCLRAQGSYQVTGRTAADGIRDVPALDYQPAVDFTIYLEFFEFLLKCVSSILSLIE